MDITLTSSDITGRVFQTDPQSRRRRDGKLVPRLIHDPAPRHRPGRVTRRELAVRRYCGVRTGRTVPTGTRGVVWRYRADFEYDALVRVCLERGESALSDRCAFLYVSMNGVWSVDARLYDPHGYMSGMSSPLGCVQAGPRPARVHP